MSDYTSQHEYDGELLSAYLDEELSPEERAAVEARLAHDPAAREMLHQLRAVSQAVQGLPLEIVGHDLGDAVLRRVTQSGQPFPPSAPGSANGDAADIDRAGPRQDTFLPKVTIGHTRRGWVWASLAVAAALLVMMFQPDRQANENLPSVALHDEQAAREGAGAGAADRGELEFRSLSESAPAQVPSNAEATDLAASAERADVERNREGRQSNASNAFPATEPGVEPGNERASGLGAVADAGPAAARGGEIRQTMRSFDAAADTMAPPQSPPTGVVAETAVDSAAANRPSATPPRDPGGKLTEQVADVPTQDEQPVVVRVLARREALQNKTFERLLESQGIEFEVEAEAMASAPTAGGQSEPLPVEEGKAEQFRENSSRQPTSGSGEELVLVDAPVSVITSSLETLSADNVNYLGIQVDENVAPAASDELAAGTTADYSAPEQQVLAKNQAVPQEWTKYNRGVVPPSQNVLSRDTLYFYDRADEAADRYGVDRSGGYAGGYGGASAPQRIPQQEAMLQGAQRARKEFDEQNSGRALRLQTWAFQNQSQLEQLGRRRYIAPDQSAAVKLQLADQSPAMTKRSGAADDRMRVLFVISPTDVPASSVPARNKAQ